MFNIRNKENGMLMLGCSTPTREEAEKYMVNHYQARYPELDFEIVENAPEFTCDLPDMFPQRRV